MLEYVSYEFEEPKYDVEECIQRDMTYAAPLKVKLRLIVFETDEETQRPLGQGHQGAGRLHGRHPAHDRQGHLHRQRHRAGHRLPDAPLAGRVLRPRQGQDPLLGQAAVRRPHHSLSRLLARLRVRRQGHRLSCASTGAASCRPPPSSMALGMDGEEILTTFYDVVPFEKRDAGGVRLGHALQARALARREAGLPADRRRHRRGSGAGRDQDLRPPGQAPGRQRPEDPAAVARGPGRPLPGPRRGQRRRPARSTPKPATNSTRPSIAALEELGFTTIDVLDIDHVTVGAYIRNTLRVDKNSVREDALFDIYRVMRPGEPPTVEAAEAMFKSLFFDQERYDLSSRRPGEDEHAPRARLPRRRARHPQGRRARGAARPWSACATAAARSTTSTTSATAGSARSANCWRTSTASACCAWSGRSRSACPASISTRSCRTT